MKKDTCQFNCKECTLSDDAFCIKQYKLASLLKSTLLSDEQCKYKPLFLDSDQTDLEEFTMLSNLDINSFVKQGKNLYIYSTICGNGKTSWAIRLAQKYITSIWQNTTLGCHVLFISVPRFLIELKDNISVPSQYISYIKANILKADLVIWDDIAATVGTKYEVINLLDFIDSRLSLNKSNIFTSNLGTEELANALGDRLRSRIYNNSLVIRLNGADKRGVTQGA